MWSQSSSIREPVGNAGSRAPRPLHLTMSRGPRHKCFPSEALLRHEPIRSAVPSCPFLPPTPHTVFSDPPNWLGGRWGTSWDSRSQAPCAQFPTVSLEAMLRGFHDQILSGYKLHKAKCLSCRTSQSLEDNCESQTGVVICSIFKTFVVKEYLLPSPTATTSVRAFIRVTNSPRLPRTWEFPGT